MAHSFLYLPARLASFIQKLQKNMLIQSSESRIQHRYLCFFSCTITCCQESLLFLRWLHRLKLHGRSVPAESWKSLGFAGYFDCTTHTPAPFGNDSCRDRIRNRVSTVLPRPARLQMAIQAAGTHDVPRPVANTTDFINDGRMN